MRERVRIHRTKSASAEQKTPNLQSEVRYGAQAPITVSQPTDHAEIEADAAAMAVTSGQRVAALGSSAGYGSNAVVHRDDLEKAEPDPPEDAKKTADGASAAPNPMILAMFKTGVVAQVDAAEGVALDAHIGIKVPLNDIRDNLDTTNQERLGMTVGRIEGML